MRIGLVVDGVRIQVDLDADTVAVIRSAVAARKRASQRQRERTVAKYLSAHPAATANQVHRDLGGNRKATLAAVRAARTGGAGADPRRVRARCYPVPRAREPPVSVMVSVTLNGVEVPLALGEEALATIAAAVPPVPLRDGDEVSPYMTVAEAADYLRCDRQRIYDLLSARRLSRVKGGSRVLIARAELEVHLNGERRPSR